MHFKLKRILVFTMLFLTCLSIPAFAQGKDNKVHCPIFMGKVLEVDAKDSGGNTRIRVKGYIKNCEVYEEELFVIISKDTEMLTSKCNTENKAVTEIKLEKGDNVFIKLDNVMTSSIPPQVNAKKIQISKVKN
ncbi:MAG: hypothetical protein ACRC68_15975 [Clostridium sp.]